MRSCSESLLMASGRVEDLAKSFCIQLQEKQTAAGGNGAAAAALTPTVRFAKSPRPVGDLLVEYHGQAQVVSW